jgi:hypothetical protein
VRSVRLAAVTIATIGAAAAACIHLDRVAETRVVVVHPTTHRVPSNLLRIYIEFSAPMQDDQARAHVRLLDDSGRVVRGAFLEMDQELWDQSHQRLTMLFDPGRVKRGIRSNLEMGAPLLEGHRYRVVVDSGWPDAKGAPLRAPFTHELIVGSFDGASPDPRKWVLTSPRNGTHDTLVVRFDEPLDHALAARTIGVVGMAGDARVVAGDTAWQFAPATPWAASASLRVGPALEDLAGNSVGRVFDSDTKQGGPTVQQSGRADVMVPIKIIGGPELRASR